MKLARFGEPGQERPAIVDTSGQLRDLSAHVADIRLASDPGLIERLSKLDPLHLPRVPGRPRLGPPVADRGKFIAIGLNYRDHALEAKLPIPTEPLLFTKANSCIVGAYDDIVIPRGSKKTDWEVELGIVIGRRASYVSEPEALSHVAGYLIVHDVSEREYQNERGGTWDKGKGCDTFGPIGPWLVTRDEVSDPQDLDLWLDVNGIAMQSGNTASMIFSCAELVSYVSCFMTLMPGDIVTTGTPPGVGFGRTPALYLKAGDVVSLGIARLGEQRQRVIAYEQTSSGPLR